MQSPIVTYGSRIRTLETTALCVHHTLRDPAGVVGTRSSIYKFAMTLLQKEYKIRFYEVKR